jgi:hypothetical protein
MLAPLGSLSSTFLAGGERMVPPLAYLSVPSNVVPLLPPARPANPPPGSLAVGEGTPTLFARACVRPLLDRLNAWVLDAARRQGLEPVAVLDVDHPARTAADVHRWASAGARAVLLPLMVHTSARYDNPIYEPLWRALDDTRLPLLFHRGGVRDLEPDPQPFDLALHRVAPEDPLFFDIHEVLEVSYARLALLAMIFAGVFARHPSLLVRVYGYGDLWVPYALARMDLQYQFRPERSGPGTALAPELSEQGFAPERGGYVFPVGDRPSDHFARHVQVAPEMR